MCIQKIQNIPKATKKSFFCFYFLSDVPKQKFENEDVIFETFSYFL